MMICQGISVDREGVTDRQVESESDNDEAEYDLIDTSSDDEDWEDDDDAEEKE